jgi:urease accessory protein UreH
VLTSQSALQIHPAPPGPPVPPACPALIDHDYLVEDEGELHCHWDPVIPFAGARLEQWFDLRIADSSRLYWSDALMAGRVSRGERWRFLSLVHQLRLRIGSRLAYLERYTLTPDWTSPGRGRTSDRPIERPWMCGRAPYLATALVHHPRGTTEIADALQRVLAEPAVGAAVDLVAPRLLLARFLAENGASFSRARASYRSAVLDTIFGGQELAGRK